MRLSGPLAVLLACVAGVGVPTAAGAADYSGTYYTTIGHQPRFLMVITQTGASASVTITGTGITLAGPATVAGTTLTFASDSGGGDRFACEVSFGPDGESFAGAWELASSVPARGTMTGTKTPWETYDLDTLGLPRLATSDCIELDRIRKVSRFRSGAGHDYSDDFETCRSMEHYYLTKDGVEMSTVRMFSPVTGTVIGTADEFEQEGRWKGTVIGIRPEGYPAFDVGYFHIDLWRPLFIGDRVLAGQELGTSEKASGTVTNIAVGVHTPSGYRLVSFFEFVSDAVFARYQERGVASRADLIIPRAARDADPMVCEGETPVFLGNLEHWVTLRDLLPRPPRRVLRPGR